MSRLLFAGWLVISLTTGAFGQVNDEIYGAVGFDFSTPGARSLGMGNAFAGLVDDATAAYANPAGLLWLEAPEAAVEIRYRRFETSFVNGGSYSGSPSGNGIDVLDRLRYSETSTDTSGVGFLSWVYPSERWSIALYRHEAASFSGSIAGSQGAFMGAPRFRISPLQAEIDLDLVDYGLAAGWKLTPSFWVGMGIANQRIDLESRSVAYDTFEVFDPANGIVEVSYDLSAFAEEDIVNTNSSRSSDDDFTVTAGWLWRGDRWSLGGVYRQGPTFDLAYDVELGPAGRDLVDIRGVAAEDVEAALTGNAEYRVPNVIALGGAFRATDSWTLSFEVDWIEYSRLSPSANIQVSGIELRDPELPEKPGALDDYQVDDGFEYHLGFEYAILGSRSYAIRFGSWWEPDHSIRYTGTIERIRMRFSGGDDLLHFNAGFGLAFHDGTWQVDGALDYSERRTTASLSMVFSY